MNLCTVYKSWLPGYNGSMTSLKTAGSSPGAAARERGWLRAWLPFAGLAAAVGFWVGALCAPQALRGEKGLWVALPLAACAFWAWVRAKKVLRRYERGAEGEERVAAALTELPEEWKVFHGVPFASGDLDHVLLGPPGLVVLETIRWRGRVTIRDGKLWDGDREYPGYGVEQLMERSTAFAESLQGEVLPVYTVVVVAGGRIAGGGAEPEGLSLVDESMLVEGLRSLPSVSFQVDSVSERLETMYEFTQ